MKYTRPGGDSLSKLVNGYNAVLISADVTVGQNIDGCKNGDKSFKSAITFTTDETGVQNVFAYVNRSATTTASTYTVTFNNVQLEQGSKATSYEAYIEPQIFVRNSNGVYEEFTKKSEEVYSTEEVKIGTWIDGKTVYRKTIIDTNFKTDFYFIANNIKQFVNQYGYVQRKDYPKASQFINSRAGTDMSIQFLASNTEVGIQIDWGSNWKNNYSDMFDKIIITVEYTKTTD